MMHQSVTCSVTSPSSRAADLWHHNDVISF